MFDMKETLHELKEIMTKIDYYNSEECEVDDFDLDDYTELTFELFYNVRVMINNESEIIK